MDQAACIPFSPALDSSFLCCYRFKVFADYESYVKCQEKVSELYLVSASLGTGQGAGHSIPSHPREGTCSGPGS